MVIEEDRSNFETTVKVTSKNKAIIDQVFNCLKTVFNCEATSPKMYNDEKDIFFQYITIQTKEA
ncbi:MAG: hypothetical protein ABSF44_02385 [Candidatus Bathyarchaeia archaeon]|jgi:hypothetical protein